MVVPMAIAVFVMVVVMAIVVMVCRVSVSDPKLRALNHLPTHPTVQKKKHVRMS